MRVYQGLRALAAAVTVALLVGLTSCGGGGGRGAAEGPPARRAFYFWRTTFALTPAEREALTVLQVERIYLRVFDLGWAGSQVEALGPVTGERAPAGVEIVPVVYIKAEVFKHVGAAALGFEIHELQLDCDWTDSTRDRFFGFVRALRAAAGVPLSSTIRLHQVKYRERTGVPPVERGALMFYNMGRFSADPDERMIFDARSAAKYLARVDDYPLPLDLALPIWSWTVHLRDELVVGLMQSTDPAELPALGFLRADGPERFVATRDAFLHGELLREGDVLKIEVTGPAETRAAAAMIAPRLAPAPPGSPRTLILFDLSERNLTRHGTELDTVFRAAR
jgi:hypothetical protein